MVTNSQTKVEKDFNERSILVSREFSAPLALVWRAYTESELLDQWFAPHPWRAETKSMNFAVGGYWLYAMVSPENQKHWARMDYLAIEHHKSYRVRDSFCDENGTPNPAFPSSTGSNRFTETPTGTLVQFKMYYASENDLKTVLEMGMEQGITMCVEQLEQLFLQKKIK